MTVTPTLQTTLEASIFVLAVLGSILTAANKPGYSYYGFMSYSLANTVGLIYFSTLDRPIMCATYLAFLIASIWGMYNHHPSGNPPAKFRS